MAATAVRRRVQELSCRRVDTDDLSPVVQEDHALVHASYDRVQLVFLLQKRRFLQAQLFLLAVNAL